MSIIAKKDLWVTIGVFKVLSLNEIEKYTINLQIFTMLQIYRIFLHSSKKDNLGIYAEIHQTILSHIPLNANLFIGHVSVKNKDGRVPNFGESHSW